MTNAKYTSYCGLHCLDCIPSKGNLFAAVRELQKVLEELNFEEYAKIKSQNNAISRSYPEFAEVLKEINKLECPAACRDRGGKPACRIRECVLNRNYRGCWECTSWKNCELLAPLKEVHSNLEYHLELINRVGPQDWTNKRKKHYCWD